MAREREGGGVAGKRVFPLSKVLERLEGDLEGWSSAMTSVFWRLGSGDESESSVSSWGRLRPVGSSRPEERMKDRLRADSPRSLSEGPAATLEGFCGC